MLKALRAQLKTLAAPRVAEHSQRFFKTGQGQYGEGDIFLGIRVPVLRRVARGYREMGLDQIEELLQSSIHEHRQIALFVLVEQFRRGDRSLRGRIYALYLRNTRRVNNWDLVDASAEYIVGAWLNDRSRAPLWRLAGAKIIWERRIAIMATFHYIKQGQFTDTRHIAQKLLADREDLIHKATGWMMLREVAKRDRATAEAFLNTDYRRMPRNMLRYAIEKFSEDQRQAYLKGQVSPMKRFPLFLLIAYLLLFALLAVKPYERSVWWAENLPIMLIVGGLGLTYRWFVFSNTAYALMACLIILHTIGGHFTFERVPFDGFTEFFGFERNHYDRIAHFTVGFYAHPLAELLLRRRLVLSRAVLYLFPICFILAVASAYEIFEWLYALSADPAAGIAVLGSQGDIWDAQKDMLADGLGAVTAIILFAGLNRREIRNLPSPPAVARR